MAEYDTHLQRAVDATSVAKDAGETDLATYLREQLAEQDIETHDEDWIQRVLDRHREGPELHDRERAEGLHAARKVNRWWPGVRRVTAERRPGQGVTQHTRRGNNTFTRLVETGDSTSSHEEKK